MIRPGAVGLRASAERGHSMAVNRWAARRFLNVADEGAGLCVSCFGFLGSLFPGSAPDCLTFGARA